MNRQNLQGEKNRAGVELSEWDGAILLSCKAKNNF